MVALVDAGELGQRLRAHRAIILRLPAWRGIPPVPRLQRHWFAQDQDGNVWYCGEISQEHETFEGDDPEELELVSIDGSWKAGRDGARPGRIALAFPQVGDVYREELSPGDAEDAAEVTSLAGTESVPAASRGGECLVTRNVSPLEPGSEETKYYAPGVGLILEVGGDGDRNELVEFTIP